MFIYYTEMLNEYNINQCSELPDKLPCIEIINKRFNGCNDR